ncbi:MAG: hypothetical protein ACI97A_000167 [Planctomycetota bacterium]|jgi:hypothetical protein
MRKNTDQNRLSPKRFPAHRLERLLDTVEALDDLRLLAGEEDRVGQKNRFLRKKNKIRGELFAILESIRPHALSRLTHSARQEDHLLTEEVALLAVLFHRRIQQSEHFMSGRDLLWILADSSYELACCSQLLRESSPLRAHGALLVYQDPEEEPQELLNLHFALDTDLFQKLSAHEQPKELESSQPFADATGHFLEFVAFIEETQYRAAKAFDLGIWRELLGEPMESLATLQTRLEQKWHQLDRRLSKTEHADRFPLIRFRQEFALTDAETVIIVALLAQEAFAGAASLEALDLLRLISASPRGLLRRRRLLSPKGRLMHQGILITTEGENLNQVPGEIALAPWVVERLLATKISPDSKIASDERIEFHDFLAGLNGSDEFYDLL